MANDDYMSRKARRRRDQHLENLIGTNFRARFRIPGTRLVIWFGVVRQRVQRSRV